MRSVAVTEAAWAAAAAAAIAVAAAAAAVATAVAAAAACSPSDLVMGIHLQPYRSNSKSSGRATAAQDNLYKQQNNCQALITAVTKL